MSLFPPQPDSLFEAFWQAYPRQPDGKQKDKGHARKAWARAIRLCPPSTLISAARRYAATKPTKYIKYPATWLNGECWLEWLDGAEKKEDAKAKEEARLEAVAFLVKRKIRTTSYSDHDIIAAMKAGKLTAEECKAYGVMV